MSETTMKKQLTKSVREYLDTLVWDGRARLARWLYENAIRLDPGMHSDDELQKIIPRGDSSRDEASAAREDDPLIDVLYRALGDRTGKLRVSDAFLICGLEASKVTQDQIERFGRAIRELGWERRRRRYNGNLEYAYVKGDAIEREVELIVEYDPHMRIVRIGINRDQSSATN